MNSHVSWSSTVFRTFTGHNVSQKPDNASSHISDTGPWQTASAHWQSPSLPGIAFVIHFSAGYISSGGPRPGLLCCRGAPRRLRRRENRVKAGNTAVPEVVLFLYWSRRRGRGCICPGGLQCILFSDNGVARADSRDSAESRSQQFSTCVGAGYPNKSKSCPIRLQAVYRISARTYP